MIKVDRRHKGGQSMDDNIWEYPFGELDEDDEIFFQTGCHLFGCHPARLNLDFLIGQIKNRIIFGDKRFV